MNDRLAARFSRQIALPEVGGGGQERLARSRVLVVGCGALGSVQAELLARAGVGTLRIVDRDVVELHNLQRQVLFDEQDAEDRLPKAIAAARRLRSINSSLAVEEHVLDVTRANLPGLLAGVDVVLDATDNFATRYLINDACIATGKPWVYGGVVGVDGTTMAIRPGFGPCLRCFLPAEIDAAHMPTCDTRGVLNTAVALVASLQVSDAYKLLLGTGDEFPLRAIDAWRGSVTSLRLKKDESCVCCVGRHYEYLDGTRGTSASVLCGRDAVQVSPMRPVGLDLVELRSQLGAVGTVRGSEFVIELSVGVHRLLVFRDGRVLVHGTSEAGVARSLVARYLGL